MTVSDKMNLDETSHYTWLIAPETLGAPWELRMTEYKGKPVPVFIAKERMHPDQRSDAGGRPAPQSILREIGLIYGPPL